MLTMNETRREWPSRCLGMAQTTERRDGFDVLRSLVFSKLASHCKNKKIVLKVQFFFQKAYHRSILFYSGSQMFWFL